MTKKKMIFQSGNKYISIKLHYIGELMKIYEIELEFCRSKDQITDIFIKSLNADVFWKLKITLRVIDFKAWHSGNY